jgi:hypothetical protein
MSVKSTSIDVFLQIKENGLLNKRQTEVYEKLYYKGPMTCSECLQELGLQTNQSGRLTELKQKGVIIEGEKRKCRVTGYEVYTWKTTNELPKKKSYRSRKQDRQEALKLVKHIKETTLLSGSSLASFNRVEEIIREL